VTQTITVQSFLSNCDIRNLGAQIVSQQPGSGSITLWLRQSVHGRDCRNRETCWVIALVPGGGTVSQVQVSNEASPNGPPASTPTANGGYYEEVAAGATVALDGSRSSDPDGRPLSFQWDQIGGPPVVLDDRNKVDPRFTAPKLRDGATLTFRLTVANNLGDTRTDDVLVRVAPK
jgi:hypothetical protein